MIKKPNKDFQGPGARVYRGESDECVKKWSSQVWREASWKRSQAAIENPWIRPNLDTNPNLCQPRLACQDDLGRGFRNPG